MRSTEYEPTARPIPAASTAAMAPNVAWTRAIEQAFRFANEVLQVLLLWYKIALAAQLSAVVGKRNPRFARYAEASKSGTLRLHRPRRRSNLA